MLTVDERVHSNCTVTKAEMKKRNRQHASATCSAHCCCWWEWIRFEGHVHFVRQKEGIKFLQERELVNIYCNTELSTVVSLHSTWCHPNIAPYATTQYSTTIYTDCLLELLWFPCGRGGVHRFCRLALYNMHTQTDSMMCADCVLWETSTFQQNLKLNDGSLIALHNIVIESWICSTTKIHLFVTFLLLTRVYYYYSTTSTMVALRSKR